MYFNPFDIAMTKETFQFAERKVKNHFRIVRGAGHLYQYDVKTLAYLDKHEIKSGVFAHLCKYHYKQNESKKNEEYSHFYSICLHDNNILNAIERGSSFIKLSQLMLYIAVHEIVHIVRFDNREADFDASPEEKEQEENKVHNITKDILRDSIYPDLKIIMDCFSNRYNISGCFN